MMEDRERPVLKIEDLKLSFHGPQGVVPAVRGVSLTVAPGEVVALVGESGCGKTALCRAILGLHAQHAVIEGGSIQLCGREITTMTEGELQQVRGREGAMVFQDPMSSLNPTVSVGGQIAEAILTHQRRTILQTGGRDCQSVGGSVGRKIFRSTPFGRKCVGSGLVDGMDGSEPIDSMGGRRISRAEAKAQAIELLRLVEIPEPELRYGQYPHHFSGGMRQRVAIAIALACNPALLIADEPTTSLDVDTQNRIMDLLARLCRGGGGTGSGRPVNGQEQGQPTAGSGGSADGQEESPAGSGGSADGQGQTRASEAAASGRGLLFVTHDLGLAERLADRIAVMKDGVIVEAGPTARIFENPQHDYTRKLLGYVAYGKGTSHYHGRLLEPEGAARRTPQCDGTPLMEASHITKRFAMGTGAGRKQVQTILSDFSMRLYQGEIVGIVGPSGCGKSTLARCIMGIYQPEMGQIILRPGCRKQMIFQDSASAFNPHMTLEEIIAEPLVIAARRGRTEELPEPLKNCGRRLDRRKLQERVYEMMEQVGLPAELAGRHPYDVSGGQRQRAAIARALITDPDLLIADEPISSLDVSIQSQIIHLLKRLHDERQLTMLLIAHDLPMVEHVSDRVIRMGSAD